MQGVEPELFLKKGKADIKTRFFGANLSRVGAFGVLGTLIGMASDVNANTQSLVGNTRDYIAHKSHGDCASSDLDALMIAIDIQSSFGAMFLTMSVLGGLL